MADSSYNPKLTANQPGGSAIVDRNLNEIKAALDTVANAETNSAVTTTNKSYAVTTNDAFVLVSAAATITLPDAANMKGKIIYVKNITSAASVTVAASRSQSIDGHTTITLAALTAVRALSDGSNWWEV